MLKWNQRTALLALAAMLVATAGLSLAAPPTRATLAFDDEVGDAIQSDGLGSYSGRFGGRNGDFTISTGEDSIYFDFSQDVSVTALTPFGSAGDSGTIDGVDLTIDNLDGDAGTELLVSARFEFIAPAPDGSGPTDWRLWMTMRLERRDSSGDGVADTFVLTRPAPDPFRYDAFLGWRTDPEQNPATGPRRGPPYKDDGWRSAGQFDMAWGATIEK
jgi:hypothetical protein